MAAFVVVTSLLDIVEQQLVLQPDPSLFLREKEMIVFLLRKLRFLQAFVEVSRKKINCPRAKEMLVAEIRGVAAEAESRIESKLRQLYLAAERGECVAVACWELHLILPKLVKDIEPLETRIIAMRDADIASQGVDSSTNDLEDKDIMDGGVSHNDLEIEDEIVVGFEKEVERLLYRLNWQSVKREVIPIVGEGGIGKTTLAKMMFDHPAIVACFQIRAWVVVSQEHSLKQILIGLLGCIVPMTTEISNKDEAQLVEQLRKSLMVRRYFIVLDDIWTCDAWDAIQGCFPLSSNGSRVVITTRSKEVAGYMTHTEPYRLRSLGSNNSWELFSQKVFREGCTRTPELEQLGHDIVRLCKGLPLAIVVIAGLLASAKGSSKIWREILETLTGNYATILNILWLSFDYLPSQLKACFLYFGVFPEDSDIPCKKIINLWVAEGFLKPERNKSLEEVAKNCLFDLINRRLVEVNGRSIDGKVKSCKIHDRLHEVSVGEAKKENITCFISGNYALKSSRWFSCRSSHWPFTESSFGSHTLGTARSILYFGKDLYLSNCKLACPSLELLRVLDLCSVKCLHSMPRGVENLFCSRYLALITVGSLYKYRWFKLRNLQTVIVTSWIEKCPLQLPCNILNLPQLRHLYLEKRCSQYLPSEVREKLQTLYWLKVGSRDQNPDFGMVLNLKELGISVEGELVPGCLDGLVSLRLLEKLKIEVGRVERFSLPIGIPPNLKKLTLLSTYLPWKEMDVVLPVAEP